MGGGLGTLESMVTLVPPPCVTVDVGSVATATWKESSAIAPTVCVVFISTAGTPPTAVDPAMTTVSPVIRP